MKKCLFGILGVGKMGGSILGGVQQKELFQPSNIAIYSTNEEKKAHFQSLGMVVMENIHDLFENTEIILLGIKPQMYETVLTGLEDIDFSNKTIISLAPGKTLAYLETIFPNALIVRAMPNTPALISYSTTTLSYNKENDKLNEIKKIFDSIGTYRIVPEWQIDEAIPLNGSMPAYLFEFAKGFIECGIKHGLNEEDAKSLCFNAIIGSCKLALQSNDSLETLINNVCSKGGTTIAGLNQLREKKMNEAIEACYDKCVERSKELQK